MGPQDSQFITREPVNLLSVLIDIITPEEFQDFIINLLRTPEYFVSQGEGANIVLLSLWDLLRARRKNEYRNYVLNAAMIIPISKSLVEGARFLKNKTPIRYMPFHFFIDLLSVMESREYTVYLLGGEDHVLKKAERNIRQTFPRLRIVGRCSASIRKQVEGTIVEAIRKTSPQLLLVGRGVRDGELWIAKNHQRLNQGLRIWCSDLFDVFAEQKTRPKDKIFELGLEGLFYCFRNPLKFFRIFPYLYYKFLLLFYKLFR